MRQFAKNRLSENSQKTETLKNGGTDNNCCSKNCQKQEAIVTLMSGPLENPV